MADIEQKKRIRLGHRISAERMVTQVYDKLGETSVNLSKLKQLKTAISIKLDTLVQLDSSYSACSKMKRRFLMKLSKQTNGMAS